MGKSHPRHRRKTGLKPGVGKRERTIAECATLGEVRANVDRLDREIVRLLAHRGRYVLQAARFKKTKAEVHAPGRVEQVVENVRRYAAEFGAPADVVEKGYRVLIEGFTETELAAHATGK